MALIIFLVIAAAFGFLCRRMAQKRGRDENWAFLMGAVFGLLAVLAYLTLGETDERKVERIKRAMNS